MEEMQTNNKFKELLDKLQQESWQLELLISGFAIFGLIAALTPLKISLLEAMAFEKKYFDLAYEFAIMSCYILIINLIIHVVLRGLWIGAIGLRYVSNEIDYKELNYNKRFTNYLKKKVGSFDSYIAKLENYCSILFAVTFLTLFYFISVFCLFIIFLLAGNLTLESGIPKTIGILFFTFFIILYFLTCLIVFIDFITQGFLKKKEWTSFLYMPIYKIFSYLTLSFLYRPLVYNFLDNKFGRRLAFILVPLYATLFYASTLNNVRSKYISPTDSYSSINYAIPNNYLSLLKENQFIRTASIQSKIINKPYLEVFIPFNKKLEDKLLDLNKSLASQNDNRGFKSNFTLFSNSSTRNKRKERLKKNDSIYAVYLKTFNNNFILKIDNTNYTSDFIITKVNNQLGFETVLPIKNITEGKHLLTIDRNIIIERNKEIEIQKVVHIPFWYYKK